MNRISKLKTELSKLSGVDFHSPKYREVFKRHMGNETEETELEEAKAQDAVADAAVVDKAEEVVKDVVADEAVESTDEQPAETNKDEAELEEAIEEDKEADAEVDKTEATEETETDPITETEPETTPEPEPELSAEEKALRDIIGESDDESDETPTNEAEEKPEAVDVATEAESQPAIDLNGKLLETQLELELVKAGVREDRLEVAKRLFLPELKAGASVEAIRGMIAQYPEWIGKQGGAQGFGMPLGDKSSALTNEERALKRMGINPRD